MDNHSLTAAFKETREGEKILPQLRQHLLAIFDSQPDSHPLLLRWLDQAQYEHPLPITDFLVLRKEMEAVLKQQQRKDAASADTLIEVVAAPDAATLVAEQTMLGPQASAPFNDQATLLANTSDYTPLPERSDLAGLHEAATTLNTTPPVSATTSPSFNDSSHKTQRFPGRWILGGLVLTALITLPFLLPKEQKPTVPAQELVSEQAFVSEQTTPLPAENEQPIAEVPESVKPLSDAGPSPAPTLALADMTEEQLMQELDKRTQEGQLFPIQGNLSAYQVLYELERRNPDGNNALKARISIKDAHVLQAEMARIHNDWEYAQQHLNAAFNVLR